MVIEQSISAAVNVRRHTLGYIVIFGMSFPTRKNRKAYACCMARRFLTNSTLFSSSLLLDF